MTREQLTALRKQLVEWKQYLSAMILDVEDILDNDMEDDTCDTQ